MVGLIPSVVGTCYAVQIKTPEALVAVVVVMVLWARSFSQTVVVLFVGMINQAALIVPHPPLPPPRIPMFFPHIIQPAQDD